MTQFVKLKPRHRTYNATEKAKIAAAGFALGAVYGRGFRNRSVFINRSQLRDAHQGKIFSTHLEGNDVYLVAQEIQRDPVTRQVHHISFQAVKPGEYVRTRVPVLLDKDDPDRMHKKAKSVFPTRRSVELWGKVEKIPPSIRLDVHGMETDENVSLKDLELPETVQFTEDNSDVTLANCVRVKQPAPASTETPVMPSTEEGGQSAEQVDASGTAA